MIPAAHTVRKAPGVTFLARHAEELQFGFDATRAGVVEVPNAPRVAALLRELPAQTTEPALLQALRTAGISADAARILVEEFCSFGLWTRESAQVHTPVLVWGSSPLALAVSAGLREEGIPVQELAAPQPPQLTEANLLSTLADIPLHLPIIGVDLLGHAMEIAFAARAHAHTWLPITGLDTRVLMGPFRKAGSGPCLMCLNLYRTDIDPEWFRVVQAGIGHWPILDPQVTAVTVAYTVVAVRSFLNHPLPPGAHPVRWLSGEINEIDVFGRNEQRFLTQHKHCPVCFAAD